MREKLEKSLQEPAQLVRWTEDEPRWEVYEKPLDTMVEDVCLP